MSPSGLKSKTLSAAEFQTGSNSAIRKNLKQYTFPLPLMQPLFSNIRDIITHKQVASVV
jgi:hypothetical protein